MIVYALLLIFTLVDSTVTPATGYVRQNVSEEIHMMFSNLTPDHLGFKNFSNERSDGFSISSMPSINASNNSIANIK